MKRKFKFLFSSKILLIILTCVCFFFVGITFFTDILSKPMQKITSSVIIPLQKGVNGIGLWFTEKSDKFASIQELQDENDTLNEKIDELSAENVRLQEQQIELSELQKLYELDNSYSDYKKTGANVIGRSSNNWYSTFTIDKGSNDGIKKDMNVIAGDGLVGLVTDVYNNSSIVRAVIDDNSSVSAMHMNTSDICTVCGNLQLLNDGYIELKYLNKDCDISDGDMIVTSNISSKYLEGILIGYAKNVEMDANNLTKSGYIVPAVDFKHLQKVLVILDKKTVAEKED